MVEWSFQTRRYRIEYERGSYLSYALIFTVPKGEWPLAAAVDVGCKKTRQALVREVCARATERLVKDRLQALLVEAGVV